MGLGSVVAIGHRAAAALRHGTRVRVVAPVAASIYLAAGEEIVWLGGPDATLHPRAIVLSTPPPTDRCAAGDALVIPPWNCPPWCPEPAAADARAAAALIAGAARLASAAATLGEPTGFGARLVGAPLAFPLADAARWSDRLAAACADDEPDAAAAAALGLLGLGPGLTPSGDDFVGGVFFARAVLAEAGACDRAGWRVASGAVRAAAARLTHPLSAALLGDLLDGQAWAPLHAVCGALAAADDAAAREAARRFVRLGHSSGWDVLAGVLAGAAC